MNSLWLNTSDSNYLMPGKSSTCLLVGRTFVCQFYIVTINNWVVLTLVTLFYYCVICTLFCHWRLLSLIHFLCTVISQGFSLFFCFVFCQNVFIFCRLHFASWKKEFSASYYFLHVITLSSLINWWMFSYSFLYFSKHLSRKYFRLSANQGSPS